MFTFLKPKHVQHGELLLKGVDKFVSYKRDILKPDRLEEISALREEFAGILKSGSKEDAEASAEKLTTACEKAAPHVEHAGLRENIEVIVVAFVIALGIRAYFLQPFKIPTGSMQPTLNGIIATQTDTGSPNVLKQAFDVLALGRNYVREVAPQDDEIIGLEESKPGYFFTATTIRMASGNDLKLWAPAEQVLMRLQKFSPNGLPFAPTKSERNGDATNAFKATTPVKVKKDQLLVEGFIDTGDQVLVNKFSYHFRRPTRGEVFVFNTKGIVGIQVPSSQGSQHYIKRLAGTPGDHLEVRSLAGVPRDTKRAELFINGQRASEPGFVRVMKAEEGYGGYSMDGTTHDITLSTEEGGRQYFAMGDNSYNSYDSRGWGPVPERNVVGPALFAYYPFGRHWGLIK